MKTGRRWVVVDTETDGLYEPIHVVEIAAQAMVGWEPSGEPFQIFLNHGVPIPPEATAIHGYTEAFLRRHGLDPVEAHRRFAEYAGGDPIACHNISYDWNRALEPEWGRLGVSPVGTRGFCTMLLSRRVIHETSKFNLAALRQHFGIQSGRSHHAASDVDAVVQLFKGVMAPRLAEAGIDTFPAVQEFTRQTPVKMCLSLVMRAVERHPVARPANEKDEWYVLDSDDQSHGPHQAAYIAGLTGGAPCYVWREGMNGWAISTDVPRFVELGAVAAAEPPPRPAVLSVPKTMAELLGVCRGLMASGGLTNKEVFFLADWLSDADFLDEWPASELAEILEDILKDRAVTKEEKSRLADFLGKII